MNPFGWTMTTWTIAYSAFAVIILVTAAAASMWLINRENRQVRQRRTRGHRRRRVVRRYERVRAAVRLTVNRLRFPDNIPAADGSAWRELTPEERLTYLRSVADQIRDKATTITNGIVLPEGTFYPASHRDQHQAWVDAAFAQVDAAWRAELEAAR